MRGDGARNLDPRSGLQAVLPGRDDLFAGCDAVIDDGDPIADLADFKGPRFDGTVRFDEVGVVSVWPALQRPRRHRHHIRRSARQQPDVEELAWPQGAILVGESALDAHRARSLRDLVVENRQRALGQLPVVVPAHREDADRTGFQRGPDGGELAFRQGEDDRDRLELSYDNEAGCIGRMNDVALIHQPDAGSAAQRRGNCRIAELRLRAVDRRPIALDLRLELRHRGALRIELLLRGEVARRKIGETLQVELCVGEVRLVLRLLGNRLVERGLKGAGIDLRQEIARLDVLTFGECYLYQLTIEPRLDRDRVKGLH